MRDIIFVKYERYLSNRPSINSISNEGRVGKQNCKLWYKNYVSIWAQV